MRFGSSLDSKTPQQMTMLQYKFTCHDAEGRSCSQLEGDTRLAMPAVVRAELLQEPPWPVPPLAWAISKAEDIQLLGSALRSPVALTSRRDAVRSLKAAVAVLVLLAMRMPTSSHVSLWRHANAHVES